MTTKEIAESYAKSYTDVYEVIKLFPHPMKGFVKLGMQVHRCINVNDKGKTIYYYTTSNKGCFHAQFHDTVVEGWPEFWKRITNPLDIKISGGGPTGQEQPTDSEVTEQIVKLYETLDI
jgi:hypothetical protein